ncbi:glycoside hydrolase family 47 protein [Vararia minispora EC-137]|uniref:Glycoside hydrolase family 47 protein n=1 Tax=Vararia minispora EC-137 TaxID=1314806 RepID=A0ACB8QWA4_9AGAM|nr:glycoside hydrolase family 47 protein [Vararia minispora EC-137]
MMNLFLPVIFATGALAGPVQLPGLTVPANAVANKQAVVDIFTESYQAYRKFAFGHDQLNPLSRTPTDPRNGWGATIVDGMGTMDFLEEALDFTSKINFNSSNTPDTVNFFETTIRYLGGMLSAYELTGQQHQFLVDQARQLGNRLSLVWDQGNTIPFNQVFFQNNTLVNELIGIATGGTGAVCSKHTGNDTYRRLAEGGVRQIAALPKPLPGLPAQVLNVTTNQPADGYVTWGGGSDSYFEYLIKYARLTNTDDQIFADNWLTAVDSSIKVLLHTSTVGNHVYLADFDDNRLIRHIGSHLACFYGGNWILGGKLANNDTIFNIGLQLTDACWNTYASDATGIGPEAFAFVSKDGNFTGGSPPTQEQLGFYNQHGFYITNSGYFERPEVLESNFYAWRATGDTKYFDRAASAVTSFNRFLKTNSGFASIGDVNSVQNTRIDDMESFWFAEVLKCRPNPVRTNVEPICSYLTFDDPSHISLDEWVFNTEAHPFPAPPAKPVYGSGVQTESEQPFTGQPGPTPAVSPIVTQGPVATVTATATMNITMAAMA